MYDYFYGQQAELFSFYRVPKVLFTDEKFSNISSDAKLLYGIMLDRMNLSAKNGWVDELGRVYIIFTIEEIKGALGCAEKKAVKLLHAKAFDLFLQAAFAGNFAGAINLAVAYEKGEGVEVDSKEARKWLEMAADYGSSKAMP